MNIPAPRKSSPDPTKFPPCPQPDFSRIDDGVTEYDCLCAPSAKASRAVPGASGPVQSSPVQFLHSFEPYSSSRGSRAHSTEYLQAWSS
ncbi:hypothetical protein LZ554_007877 [Drepanopeziza brunnea f. sp. 'monogermtubi']|nr:hypothetical protein LZ554_007877 [Drepanopeziza brunnea f. sp. 'monogermtubi']